MGITSFGIFRTKQLSADNYAAIAQKVAGDLHTVRNQLNIDLSTQKQQSPQLEAALHELQQIEAAIRLGSSSAQLASDPLFGNDNFDNGNLAQNNGVVGQATQPSPREIAKKQAQEAKQSAAFLEQQLQHIVKAYNNIMTTPQVSAKENQTVAAKISNVFSDFFTKIADLFRRLAGRPVRGNWTHSAAQTTVQQQFNAVFSRAESAKELISAKNPDVSPTMQQFRPMYMGL